MGYFRDSNSKSRKVPTYYNNFSSFGNNDSHPRKFQRNNRNNRYGRFSKRRPSNNVLDEKMYIKKIDKIKEIEEYKPKIEFKDLKIDKQLLSNVFAKGYKAPTPIQDQAIPHILEGKDVVGVANTGTGKTAAFLVPLMEKVVKNRREKVLIIAPTRELAEQINDELYSLSRGLRIFSVPCIGGASLYRQVNNIRRGFSFIIGTPGRIKDLTERNVLNLSQFNTVVLDEVDRMLDMGFIDDIKLLVSLLPKERQSLFFSATLDQKVEKVMKLIIKDEYVNISVKTGNTSDNVDQDVVKYTDNPDRLNKLAELLKTPEFSKVLVFVNTKRGVDKLNRELREIGLRTESIHGDKRQNERQRAIDNFKQARAEVLIATDVAARGLDISSVSHVINFDIPENYDDYIHRIGRTGRANQKGVALTFLKKI